ncbi:MAG: hypothetical protein WBV18_09120 [Methyloceanibacter sp.]|uniref:hypothetical protein n=1 Tax=Methyloceanibacter sp. TaxID=1965321 RepID=UPI003C67EE8A
MAYSYSGTLAYILSEIDTPIPGLYLAGQDVASPGIPGALWGGLLSAASVDARVFKHFRE